MKRTILVDADIVAYKFASANEEVYYWDGADSEPSTESDFEGAKRDAEAYLEDLAKHLQATDIVVCLSDPTNRYFRHDLWEGYKGNRKGTRKPEHLMAVKEWFATKYQTYQRPNLEADDCMGILATHPTLIRGEKIMVSEDKDMQTVPALLYNPQKDNRPRKISKLAAMRYHLWQTIVGDQTDGYPGAPFVGDSSPEAKAVLTAPTCVAAWQHVMAAFRRARWKDSPDEQAIANRALLQARLARILWASDWDFAAKKPRLWTPPVS